MRSNHSRLLWQNNCYCEYQSSMNIWGGGIEVVKTMINILLHNNCSVKEARHFLYIYFWVNITTDS